MVDERTLLEEKMEIKINVWIFTCSFFKTHLARMYIKFHLGFFAVLLFLVLGCQNKNKPVDKITIAEMDSLLYAGMEVYRRDPKDAIFYFRQAAIGYESLDSFKQAGISFLNVAGIFEEHTGQLESAEYYASCSLKNCPDYFKSIC